MRLCWYRITLGLWNLVVRVYFIALLSWGSPGIYGFMLKLMLCSMGVEWTSRSRQLCKGSVNCNSCIFKATTSISHKSENGITVHILLILSNNSSIFSILVLSYLFIVSFISISIYYLNLSFWTFIIGTYLRSRVSFNRIFWTCLSFRIGRKKLRSHSVL